MGKGVRVDTLSPPFVKKTEPEGGSQGGSDIHEEGRKEVEKGEKR
jgi:hypothetical protein